MQIRMALMWIRVWREFALQLLGFWEQVSGIIGNLLAGGYRCRMYLVEIINEFVATLCWECLRQDSLDMRGM